MGTTGILAGVDNLWLLERDQKEEGILHTRGRDIEDNKWRLNFLVLQR